MISQGQPLIAADRLWVQLTKALTLVRQPTTVEEAMDMGQSLREDWSSRPANCFKNVSISKIKFPEILGGFHLAGATELEIAQTFFKELCTTDNRALRKNPIFKEIRDKSTSILNLKFTE